MLWVCLCPYGLFFRWSPLFEFLFVFIRTGDKLNIDVASFSHKCPLCQVKHIECVSLCLYMYMYLVYPLLMGTPYNGHNRNTPIELDMFNGRVS